MRAMWIALKLHLWKVMKRVNFVIAQWYINLVGYGKFLACSNFPECKNTKPITVGTGVTCPKCKEGES